MIDLFNEDKIDIPDGAVEFSFAGGKFAVTTSGEVLKHKDTKAGSGWITLKPKIDRNDGRKKAVLRHDNKAKTVDIAKIMVMVIAGEQRDRNWSVGFYDDNSNNTDISNLCWRKFQGRGGFGIKVPIEGV